jgi:hypothetical protein
MQVLCTPMHLLALNLVNAPGATAAARVVTLRASTPAALIARSLRMLPAYGVGGILNGALTGRGREAVARHFLLRRGGKASEQLAGTTVELRNWSSRIVELVTRNGGGGGKSWEAGGFAGAGGGGGRVGIGSVGNRKGKSGGGSQKNFGNIEIADGPLAARRAASEVPAAMGGVGTAPRFALMSQATLQAAAREESTASATVAFSSGTARVSMCGASHTAQAQTRGGGLWFDPRRYQRRGDRLIRSPSGGWRWGRGRPAAAGATRTVATASG